ncbi:hypothetical protein GTA08_BOTSDO08793 [Botryosphaeria dothidea]|uniref:Uncharacterized protein n=1 Tax=Botryosphaeria dothidea TaxID=55169 RepID=A0A8H4MZF7_9PEZI|nr:hypothetical protein GTA08_BOTSDO08793 [Botryosphaeria dothidea]
MQFLSFISVATALAAPALAQASCQVRLYASLLHGGVCATIPFTTAHNTVIPLRDINSLPNCSVQVNAEVGQTCRYFSGCGNNRDFTFGVAGTIGC